MSTTVGEELGVAVAVDKATQTHNFVRFCRLLLELAPAILSCVFKERFKASEGGVDWSASQASVVLGQMDDCSKRRLGKACLDKIASGNCQEWDITLLASLLLVHPGYMAGVKQAKEAIGIIRDARNGMMHSNILAKQAMPEDEFKRGWQIVSTALEELMDCLTLSERDNYRVQIKSIATEVCQLSKVETILEAFRLEIREMSEAACHKAEEALKATEKAATMSQVERIVSAQLESLLNAQGRLDLSKLPGGLCDVMLNNKKKYRLLSEAGKGGMGTVFRAVPHDDMNQQVAFKVCETTSPERAKREVAILMKLAELRHSNIVTFLDSAMHNSHVVIIMELIKGESLEEWLRKKQKGQATKPVTWQESLDIMVQLLNGMAVIHDLDIAHRDLKPANLMFDEATGKLVIVDFGLSKQHNTNSTMTVGYGQLGTILYMSPEQLECNVKDISFQTDVWAMGVIWHELLTFLTPFEPAAWPENDKEGGTSSSGSGSTPSRSLTKRQEALMIHRIFASQPSNLTLLKRVQVPEQIVNIISKCLDPKKERRYERAGDMLKHVNDAHVEIEEKLRLERVSQITQQGFAGSCALYKLFKDWTAAEVATLLRDVCNDERMLFVGSHKKPAINTVVIYPYVKTCTGMGSCSCNTIITHTSMSHRYADAADIVMACNVDGKTMLSLSPHDLEVDLKLSKLKVKRLMTEIKMENHWVFSSRDVVVLGQHLDVVDDAGSNVAKGGESIAASVGEVKAQVDDAKRKQDVITFAGFEVVKEEDSVIASLDVVKAQMDKAERKEDVQATTVSEVAKGGLSVVALVNMVKAQMEEAERKQDVTCIIEMMRKHEGDADVQEWGCKALQNLADFNEDNQVRIGKAGGIEVVICAMRKHQLWSSGCEVLRIFADNHDNRVKVAEGIEVVISAMRKHVEDADVQKKGCEALGTFAWYGDAMVKVAEAGGIEVVISAMKKHVEDADVQKKGCDALGRLANNDDDDTKVKVAEAGGIEVVISAMKKHVEDADVQKKGCDALGRLANDDDTKVKVAEAGGIEVVISAMRKHVENVRVQKQGCEVLHIFALNDDMKVKVAEAGGIEVVIYAMKKHVEDSWLQKRGCDTLGILAGNHDNKVKVAEAGGIEVVISAMKKHVEDKDVQKTGCDVLHNLAQNHENQVKVAEAGGIEVVISAMKQHANSAFLQEVGCEVLQILSVNDDNKIKIAEAGGIEVVKSAMMRHKKKTLQKIGGTLLSVLEHLHHSGGYSAQSGFSKGRKGGLGQGKRQWYGRGHG